MQKNCVSTEQHESCHGSALYQSANNKVTFDDFYSEEVLPAFGKISSTGIYTTSGNVEPTFYNAFTN